MVREILIWPDPRLKEKAAPVEAVDDEVQTLIGDMFETMYDAEGVGLAAPQIGVSRRVMVIDCSPRDEGAEPIALVNPEIVAAEGEITWTEGCLSIPGESEDVDRAAQVTVRYLDREGREQLLTATGLTAVAIQHELDHLNGVVFVDHLSTLKRELIKKRMKRLKLERGESRARA